MGFCKCFTMKPFQNNVIAENQSWWESDEDFSTIMAHTEYFNRDQIIGQSWLNYSVCNRALIWKRFSMGDPTRKGKIREESKRENEKVIESTVTST